MPLLSVLPSAASALPAIQRTVSKSVSVGPSLVLLAGNFQKAQCVVI